MQLIALVAATQEGPIGVEAALLTRSPHVTFVHIWGCQENGGGVKTKEQPRAPTAPVLIRKGVPPPHTPLPRTPSLAQPSLTHTGAVVGPQLEARLTLAAKGARQVHAAVLAVAVPTLVYIWDAGRRRTAEGRVRCHPSQLGPRLITHCLA